MKIDKSKAKIKKKPVNSKQIYNKSKHKKNICITFKESPIVANTKSLQKDEHVQ